MSRRTNCLPARNWTERASILQRRTFGYYGARCYDPVIGRFISPDTIISNPADSQFFNRYSYCLNNPLKYVDPSGHVVNVNGFNVSAIYGVLNDPQSLMMLAGSVSNVMSEAVGSNEFQAYNSFRNMSEENAYKAYTMEKSTEHVVNIDSDDSGPKYASTTKDGADYNMTIHTELFSCRYEGDLFDWGRVVEQQVNDNILCTQADTGTMDVILDGLVKDLVSDLLPIIPVISVFDAAVQGQDVFPVVADIIVDKSISYTVPVLSPIYALATYGASEHKAYFALVQDLGGYPFR